jgi:hypothetical protein
VVANISSSGWSTRSTTPASAEEQPDSPLALIAEELRNQTARVARVDGAIAGTPFLIALVPGYLAYLWQEGIMERRMAALYGHDPRELETSAKVLALRGVHPTVDAARAALFEVRDTALPDKPTDRRPLHVWVRSIYVLLVFGGFISARTEESEKNSHWRLRAALGFLIGMAIWVTTWVFPVSFMIAMAWACESHARALGRRTLSFYGGGIRQHRGGDRRRAAPRGPRPNPARRRARPPHRALRGGPDRVRRLRQLRPPDHRLQLDRRPRCAGCSIPCHRHDIDRQSPLTGRTGRAGWLEIAPLVMWWRQPPPAVRALLSVERPAAPSGCLR